MGVERALISVYDKTGAVEFARQLVALGVEIVSTGGTARLLREAALPVREIGELTGWPEMLGGRVKTLHPKVHGGILFRRELPQHRQQAAEQGLAPIDLVVVNLYPFETTAAKPTLTAEELIENIDVGGPALLRAAAKNFASVAAVTDPADYPHLAGELSRAGELSLETRLVLARKAFAATARYDGLISTELERLAATDGALHLGERPALPEHLHLALVKHRAMRYGENPHQLAALYVPAGHPAGGLAGAKQLQGKELSYNNLVDLDAAWRLAQEFARPAAVIIKHTNPCGAAEQETLLDAYRKAYAGDPLSAYGGVLGFNRTVDRATAVEVGKLFVECIVAPGYEASAQEIFAAKKNLRLMEMPTGVAAAQLELQCIAGGV
ncbi:MAG TPA: bifunctional phosphoribosylaminoimidazolecarboxamide formyltransferase/IMP cyclohydrolase, partial [Burkholderiales bacterium]|nr:bifunctional phosphoribosylaminoimidazolecarboxamide formyltransferase/IMP cyclohydrolase [Burkholderiales bacterium]